MTSSWLAAWWSVIVQTGCLVEISTFIFPAEDEEMSELKSMFAQVKKKRNCAWLLSWIYCICCNHIVVTAIKLMWFCASQGSGHSLAGGHPCGTSHPWLLVLQEKEWLQNNQGEIITFNASAFCTCHELAIPNLFSRLCSILSLCAMVLLAFSTVYHSGLIFIFSQPRLHRAPDQVRQVTWEASTQRQDLQQITRWLSPTSAAYDLWWAIVNYLVTIGDWTSIVVPCAIVT